MKLLLLTLLAVGCAFAQNVSVSNVSLPTYILAGASYNQYTGWNGLVAGIIPETSKLGGLYASITADVLATKYTNASGKNGYVLSPTFRGGQHKVVYSDASNTITVGGDFGVSVSSITTTSVQNAVASVTPNPLGVNIGLAGSFTLSYFHQINKNWAIGVPVRMLWISGAGPNGSGVWNPVVELVLAWKPGSK